MAHIAGDRGHGTGRIVGAGVMQPILTLGYRPHLIAETIGLHLAYYAPVWGFGQVFEAKLAGELGDFFQRFDDTRDAVLSIRDPEGPTVATLFIDGAIAGRDDARLRWFITAARVRGQGLGRRLMQAACAHLDQTGVACTYLTTFAGLDPARHLYEAFGFTLALETETDPWGGGVREQRFERVCGSRKPTP